jgi:MFS family permease
VSAASGSAALDAEKRGGQGTVNVGVLMVALLAACVAFQLNASMLSPALVTIQNQLNTSAAAVAQTQTVFFTAAGVFSLFLPRLGDIIGRKRVLGGMLALMTIGCIVSALATTIDILLVGRIIQGVSGPVVPLCLIMLRAEVREPRRYGTLMGVLTAFNGGVAGVDALAGGYLAQNFGFSSVFWAMAIVAAAASACVIFLAPESRALKKERMDWIGVIPLVISVGALLVALNEAGKLALANWILVGGLMALAIIAFAVFWRVENRVAQPLVATQLLRQRSTWALLLTTLLTITGVFAIMNGIIPALAQAPGLGYRMGAEQSALWTLTPYALAGLVMGPIAGRVAASFGYRRVLRVGIVGSIVVVLVMMFVVGSDSRLLLLLVSVLLGFSYAGISNIMLNGLGIVLSPKENPGFLPGLNAGAFNIGAGLSFAVIYAVQGAFMGSGANAGAGFDAALVTGVIILVLAFLSSLLIPRPLDAEVSRHA